MGTLDKLAPFPPMSPQSGNRDSSLFDFSTAGKIQSWPACTSVEAVLWFCYNLQFWGFENFHRVRGFSNWQRTSSLELGSLTSSLNYFFVGSLIFENHAQASIHSTLIQYFLENENKAKHHVTGLHPLQNSAQFSYFLVPSWQGHRWRTQFQFLQTRLPWIV